MTAVTHAEGQVVDLLKSGPCPWSAVVDELTVGRNGQRAFVPGDLFEHRRKQGMTEEGASGLIRHLRDRGDIQTVEIGKTRRKPGIWTVRLTPDPKRPRQVDAFDLALLRQMPRNRP
jgi:hypothetical protein